MTPAVDSSFPLVVRPPTPDEVDMVAANWKHDLHSIAKHRHWGRGLHESDFWRLVNFVVDKVAIPTCHVFVAVHPDNPTIPLAWVATREGVMLYLYRCGRIRNDAPLAERVESAMLQALPVTAIRVHDFNPFRELERL